jgi:predicted membrane protein
MLHTAAIFAGLASLCLISATYYINIYSSKDSWLRASVIAMILLSLLTGLFPLAAAASVAGLWEILSGGLSWAAVLSAGVDLLAVATVLATVVVFRALVKATYRAKGQVVTTRS